jgi:hypothetical protein
MLGKVAAGLAGLGLIGGVGTVVYNNHGDATVQIKNNKTGRVQRVRIESGGQEFSCPLGIDDQLKPHDIAAGRIKLTLLQVRRQERAIMRRYPSGVAPASVVDRVNVLNSRDGRLVEAYNVQIRAHNAIIRRDCSPT